MSRLTSEEQGDFELEAIFQEHQANLARKEIRRARRTDKKRKRRGASGRNRHWGRGKQQ